MSKDKEDEVLWARNFNNNPITYHAVILLGGFYRILKRAFTSKQEYSVLDEDAAADAQDYGRDVNKRIRR